jgi:hypothetical protein
MLKNVLLLFRLDCTFICLVVHNKMLIDSFALPGQSFGQLGTGGVNVHLVLCSVVHAFKRYRDGINTLKSYSYLNQPLRKLCENVKPGDFDLG